MPERGRNERTDERKWERRLMLLARPRILIGAATFPVSLVLLIAGLAARASEGIPPILALLLVVVFFGARGAVHTRWQRGWAYLLVAWGLVFVVWGGLFDHL